MLGRNFEVCEVFGDWGVNGSTTSSYAHGWEDMLPLSGEWWEEYGVFIKYSCRDFQGESMIAISQFMHAK